MRLRAAARRAPGVEFSDEVVGGRIPREFIPSVEQAIDRSASSGQVAGYEVVDFKARLSTASTTTSTRRRWRSRSRGRACFREASARRHPKLLEPIMKIEVGHRGDYLGDVIGDINRRRGTSPTRVRRAASRRAGLRAAVRDVRLHQLPALRTSGRGTFTMEFDHYAEVPAGLVEKLMEKEA